MSDVLSIKYNLRKEKPISDHFREMLFDKETPLFAVEAGTGTAVFTDKRILISKDKGVLGKKFEYHTIPYKSIILYSIETGGSFGSDYGIRLTLLGGIDVEFEIYGKYIGSLLHKVYQTITDYAL